ncbi:spinster family MFS transporter [Hyphococcus sp.]|uniref:spinster family MFS transporter n=1 Tax=Hyphococcus sp. TaxID=2038636 RepID=UPI00207E12FB|nr:MAG: MFS transporter [Marinicaulis sp.]
MQTASPLYRGYVLFILVTVYTFNFIDRQIVGILAVPIKSELALSDTQLSLMGGLAFALFYTFLGIPIAMLADRRSRVWIMTAALAIWSAMTAACGFAQNFTQLFLARLGVGVGEAGGVAPAYSLIADYFPPENRARALAIYSYGIPIGSALGILLGGVLTSYLDWRAAFIIVGVAGLAIAPVFRLTMREPKRGGLDGASAKTGSAKISEVVKTLAAKPSFWGLSFGAASSSMMGYGLIFWLPSFFVRSFGDALPGFFAWMPGFLIPENPSPLLYASYFYATILLIGGVAGISLGGVLADKYGQAKKSAYALVPAAAFLTTIPFFVIGVLAPNLWVAFPAFLVLQALSLVWLGPVLAAFQQLVQPNMRATASALFLFINNLIGIGLGNLAIGAISDGLAAEFGDESLRYAILSGTVFYLIAAGLFIVTAPRLKRDWAN